MFHVRMKVIVLVRETGSDCDGLLGTHHLVCVNAYTWVGAFACKRGI